jgi:hypothetical protein
MTNHLKISASFSCLLFLLCTGPGLFAQDTAASRVQDTTFSNSHVFAGSQIPLQFTAGYGYQFNGRWSARAQVGYITKPYGGFIVNALETFGLDKNLGRVIKKAFTNGSIIGIGPNYHFGKNYAGVYAQYIHLRGGGISPADALSIYFKKDFTSFDVGALPAFEFSMQSNILNTGLLVGHQFQLQNPQFRIDGEVGFSKIVASKNTFNSNRALVDQTAFAKNIYKEIDDEMQSAYWKHGFIPTVNVYLVYRIRKGKQAAE